MRVLLSCFLLALASTPPLFADIVTPAELKFDQFSSRWNQMPEPVRNSSGGRAFFRDRFKDKYDDTIKDTSESDGDTQEQKNQKQDRRAKRLAKLAGDLNSIVRDNSLIHCAVELERCLAKPESTAEACHKEYLKCIRKARQQYDEFIYRAFVKEGAKIVGEATSDFNCLGMIMGALLGTDFSNALGKVDPRKKKSINKITDAVLKKKGFTFSKKPCDCGIVLYYNSKGEQIHIGVIVDATNMTVLSKWGNGKTPVWTHPVNQSPYGTRYKIYCPPERIANWCHALKQRFGLK